MATEIQGEIDQRFKVKYIVKPHEYAFYILKSQQHTILQLPKIILNKETILYLSHKNANELLKMNLCLTH